MAESLKEQTVQFGHMKRALWLQGGHFQAFRSTSYVPKGPSNSKFMSNSLLYSCYIGTWTLWVPGYEIVKLAQAWK